MHDQAIERLQAQIDKSPNHGDARLAMGYILHRYETQKSWEKLESSSRLALKHQISPVYMKKSINAHNTLGLALVNGGEEQFKAENYKVAKAKFIEFTKNHKNIKKQDLAMYLLAKSHQKLGEITEAIAVSDQFSEQHRNSQYYAALMYEAGHWSLASAQEEHTLFFFENFVKAPLKSKDTKDRQIEARVALANLYAGRGIINQAVDHYQVLARQNLDQSEAFALKAIALKADGDDKLAGLKLASTLYNQTKMPAVLAAKVSLEIDFAAEKGSLKTLKSLASQYESMLLQSNEGQIALGKLHFMSGKVYASTLKQDFDPLAVKDPTKTLEAFYSQYTALAAEFNKACEIEGKNFCGPAKFETARAAEHTLELLQDLKITETLDEKIVTHFEKRRSQILDALAEAQAKHDGDAEEVLASTTTPSGWVSQILWFNSSDWNFDRLSGNSGNGFYQWQINKTSSGVLSGGSIDE
jgi:tetratricopeptide (TPR) repeat protein